MRSQALSSSKNIAQKPVPLHNYNTIPTGYKEETSKRQQGDIPSLHQFEKKFSNRPNKNPSGDDLETMSPMKSNSNTRQTLTENQPPHIFISKKIYVSFLDETISEDQLYQLFSRFGQIRQCYICQPKYNRRVNFYYGFVAFHDIEVSRRLVHSKTIYIGDIKFKIKGIEYKPEFDSDQKIEKKALFQKSKKNTSEFRQKNSKTYSRQQREDDTAEQESSNKYSETKKDRKNKPLKTKKKSREKWSLLKKQKYSNGNDNNPPSPDYGHELPSQGQQEEGREKITSLILKQQQPTYLSPSYDESKGKRKIIKGFFNSTLKKSRCSKTIVQKLGGFIEKKHNQSSLVLMPMQPPLSADEGEESDDKVCLRLALIPSIQE